LTNFEKQDCDEIVTNPPHCSGLSYRMSWEEQRRIGLRRVRMDEEEISRRLTKDESQMNSTASPWKETRNLSRLTIF
jgi:hypothetical protein